MCGWYSVAARSAFAVETFAKLLVVRDVDEEGLSIIEARVLGELHVAHAARSEAPSNNLPGKLLTFAQRHGAIVVVGPHEGQRSHRR